MFIKTAGFKRLLKEAYKGAGLRIGAAADGVYLSGGYWVIWVKRSEIPKEKLAAIIELVGELPEEGEAYRATKDGQQYELAWNELYNAMEKARHCTCGLKITRIMLGGRTGAASRVLQYAQTGRIRLVDEGLVRMIDGNEVDIKRGHTQPEGPMGGNLPGVSWHNNIMALHIMGRTDDASTRLVQFLEGIDINERSKEYRHEVPENAGEEETEEA